MAILMTGGSGLLGRELQKLDSSIVAPTSTEMNIQDEYDVYHWVGIGRSQSRTIVHAAAFTSPPKCDEQPMKAIKTNIVGTCNVVRACSFFGCKLVYISTDYVFDGKKGNYKTTDPINPNNKYAMSKAAGELAVRMYDKSLIIRTSFIEREFPYEKAFVDQYVTRDYVDIITPMILEQIYSNKTGIVHVGTNKKSVYDLAKQRKPDVGKIKISDVNFNVPQDTSLYVEKG